MTSSDTANDSTAEHPEYYIPTADLHFLVGRTNFCVHSYFFTRESERWKKALLGKKLDREKILMGDSASTAIMLKNIPEVDLVNFFRWVIYNDDYDYDRADAQAWIGILRLAAKWEFPKVKNLALRQLNKEQMDLIERIKLYQECGAPNDSLYRFYVQLAVRPEMLTEAEFRDLGYENTALVVRARERLRAPPSPTDKMLSPVREGISEAQIFEVVSEELNSATGDTRPDNDESNEGPNGPQGQN